MSLITVNASRKYDIIVDHGVLPDAGRMIHKAIPTAGKAVLVSDDNVFSLYGETVSRSLNDSGLEVFPFLIPHGENSKNLENYGRLLNEMCLNHIVRADVVVALGGGVVGDLAGFAAATYQRGVSLVQIPTSLLAAVDSSVGGKTAVDLPAGKNQVGCFYQPSLVICDTDTLSTLPEEEYRNGCAEIIKYAILDGMAFFSMIDSIPIIQQYEDVIAHCVKIKKELVQEDERDTGVRMLLNLGHTIGHGVEHCSGYTIPHGQAVAMGLAAIVRAATEKGYCERQLCSAVCKLISKYGLPVEIPFSCAELATAALLDKKNTSDKMRLVVPFALGDCKIIDIDKTQFSDWLTAGGIK